MIWAGLFVPWVFETARNLHLREQSERENQYTKRECRSSDARALRSTAIKPVAPAATAHRARTGANSRWPFDWSPRPPGNWTACVASKITGKPKPRRRGIERMSATRLL